MEEGENDNVALIREVMEETGIKIEVGNKLGTWQFLRRRDGTIVSATNYLALPDPQQEEYTQIRLSTEHSAFSWFAPHAIYDLPVKDPSFLVALGLTTDKSLLS